MYIYGKHPVRELLETSRGKIISIFIDRPENREHYKFDVQVVDTETLDKYSDNGNHQGVVAQVTPFQYANIKDLYDYDVVAILDQVQDPQNFGAIARSAAAFSIPLIIPKDRAVGVTGTVVRASAGLIYQVPVVQVTNIARTIKTLQDEGFWAFAADMGGDSIYNAKLEPKTIIVMGGEAGIRKLTKEKCDFVVGIPIDKCVESLNVSTSFAIVASEFRRTNPTQR